MPTRIKGRPKGLHQKLARKEALALGAHVAITIDAALGPSDTGGAGAESRLRRLRGAGKLSAGTADRIGAGSWNPTIAALVFLGDQLGEHVLFLIRLGRGVIESVVQRLRPWTPEELLDLDRALKRCDHDDVVEVARALADPRRRRSVVAAARRGAPRVAEE